MYENINKMFPVQFMYSIYCALSCHLFRRLLLVYITVTKCGGVRWFPACYPVGVLKGLEFGSALLASA